MDTPVLPRSEPECYPQIASKLHLIWMLLAMTAWTLSAKLLSDHLRRAANPNRVRLYLLTVLVEWFFFVLVLAGVRRFGAPVSLVLGDHWHSAREILRDIGVAIGFWLVALLVLGVTSRLLHIDAQGRDVQFLLPRGIVETIVWVAVSVSAGICEETIFRGYLQRQFTALTGSAPGGIVLSAAGFGAAHAYQGVRRAILIGVFGAMFGILAYWRRSLRPGMIAHAWQDSLGGIVGSFMRR